MCVCVCVFMCAHCISSYLPHSGAVISKNQIPIILKPPYSSGLTTCDVWFIPRLGWKVLVLYQYKTSEIMWQRSHSCTKRGLPDMLSAMTWMIDQACKCRVAVLQGWLSTTHYAWVPVTLILLQIFRIEGYVASGLNPSSAVPRSTKFYMFWKRSG